MSNPLRIGIAGLGVVGGGVVKMLRQNADLISARAGREIQIACLSARDQNKNRGVDLSSYEWVAHPEEIARRGDVDTVVELIGGSEGTALNLARAALGNGKNLVTANKALLAHHGFELAALAEKNGVYLHYEAAVAGGIPVIKALRESFAGNKISGVYGILNGTSNYILSEMRKTRRAFGDVLKEAQALGYAEADPAFDIDGTDAAHKLCLLAALAFGTKPDLAAVQTQGIDHLTVIDIEFAAELGCRIKLLAGAVQEDGALLQTVEPCLVPENSALGLAEDVLNAVMVEGDFIGKPFLTGRGAGERPTASSVVSDLIDVARGVIIPAFGIPAQKLSGAKQMQRNTKAGHYYLRLNVADKPGVMADISGVLRDHDISIEGLVQRSYGQGRAETVPIMVHTHETTHKAMSTATAMLGQRDYCAGAPCLMLMIEAL